MRFTSIKHDKKNVTVDFNEYIECEFKDCEIIYGGGGVPVFENCSFNNCRFSLIQRAANTVDYFSLLYQKLGESGGKAFIDEQIAKIKGG